MKTTLMTLCSILILPLTGMAQTAGTLHVFPQFADGLLADGTFYQSILAATAVTDKPTTCRYRVYGPSTSRIQGNDTFTMQGVGAIGFLLSYGNLFPLATGYATLSCDQNVTATLGYIYVKGETVVSGAAVFSSPAATRAQLTVSEGGDSRLALAIANDTDSANTYQVTVYASNGNEVATRNVTIPARSSVPRFVDELISLPGNFFGRVVVSAPTGGSFSLIGFHFFGTVFLTQPATILQ